MHNSGNNLKSIELYTSNWWNVGYMNYISYNLIYISCFCKNRILFTFYLDEYAKSNSKHFWIALKKTGHDWCLPARLHPTYTPTNSVWGRLPLDDYEVVGIRTEAGYFMTGVGSEWLVSALSWLSKYFEFPSYLFPTPWPTLGITQFCIYLQNW